MAWPTNYDNLSNVASGQIIASSLENQQSGAVNALENNLGLWPQVYDSPATALNNYAADTGAANAYVMTLSPISPGTYRAGQVYSFKAANANTGDSTLNVNSLGTRHVYKFVNQLLEPNDIQAGQLVEVMYDGTNFQLMSTPGRGQGKSVYGDGSDGAVTISSNTALIQDMYYDTLVVNSGQTLSTGSFKIFCRTSLVNNGTIANNGGDASGSTPGTAVSAGSLGASTAGGAGATGNGSNASNLTNSQGAGGGAGGAGGTGSAGTAGTATPPTAAVGGNVFHTLLGMITGRTQDAALVTAGSGGGGAGGDGTAAGGGGGAGGGILVIAAPFITGSGSFEAAGGAGGNASAGDAGGGGGGGGGAICFLSDAPVAVTTSVSGGAAGSNTGTGAAGSAGSNGTVFTILNA